MNALADADLVSIRMGLRAAIARFWPEVPVVDTAKASESSRALLDFGWLSALLPVGHGGLGMGHVEAAVMAEEAGRMLVPVGYPEVQMALAVLTASERWTDISAVLADESHVAIAWETDGGFSVRCSGQPDAETFIRVKREAGKSAILLGRGTSHSDPNRVDVVRSTYLGPRADELGQAEELTVADPDGLSRIEDLGALLASAEMLGAGQKALADAVRYASEREQFGVKIGTFQGVKHPLAQMHVQLEVGQSLLYSAARAQSGSPPVRQLATSMVKSYMSEVGATAAQVALQTFGGMGFTWEHGLHLHYRRLLHLKIAFGDGYFHRRRIAQLAFDKEVAP